MPLRVGSSDAKVFLGATAAKVYIGSTLVYDPAPPPTPTGPRHTFTASIATWFGSVVGAVTARSVGSIASAAYTTAGGRAATINVLLLSDNGSEDLGASQDFIVRFGTNTGIPEADFPSRIVIKRISGGVVRVEKTYNAISGSYTTRGLGEQKDYDPSDSSDPLSPDTFASGDSVTVELYD